MAATIAVFAPSVWLTVTVEQNVQGDDDIHLHAGGQGIWIARMLRQLGQEPVVCAPVGGESGRAFLAGSAPTGGSIFGRWRPRRRPRWRSATAATATNGGGWPGPPRRC